MGGAGIVAVRGECWGELLLLFVLGVGFEGFFDGEGGFAFAFEVVGEVFLLGGGSIVSVVGLT